MEGCSTSERRPGCSQEEQLRKMMGQYQNVMSLLWSYQLPSLEGMGPSPSSLFNQRQVQSYILVGKEDKQVKQTEQTANSSMVSSDSSQLPSQDLNINASTQYQKVPKVIQTTPQKLQISEVKKKKKFETEEEYSPGDEEAYDYLEPKISESKNIPKIFGKGILNFILRNRDFTLRVLAHLGCDEQDFDRSLDYFKTHMSSIADLRGLWLDQNNSFAKVYRILSKEYLRRHSLTYIFNSRVTTLNKHIKYRNKIEKSIEEPHLFTSMKEF